MQGILAQQQQFTQQLLRTISKEFQPSEQLTSELKHQLETYFIEIKQIEYELREQLSKYCHNCAVFKYALSLAKAAADGRVRADRAGTGIFGPSHQAGGNQHRAHDSEGVQPAARTAEERAAAKALGLTDQI